MSGGPFESLAVGFVCSLPSPLPLLLLLPASQPRADLMFAAICAASGDIPLGVLPRDANAVAGLMTLVCLTTVLVAAARVPWCDEDADEAPWSDGPVVGAGRVCISQRPGASLVPLAPANITLSSSSAALIEALCALKRAAFSADTLDRGTNSASLPWLIGFWQRSVGVGWGSIDGRGPASTKSSSDRLWVSDRVLQWQTLVQAPQPVAGVMVLAPAVASGVVGGAA